MAQSEDGGLFGACFQGHIGGDGGGTCVLTFTPDGCASMGSSWIWFGLNSWCDPVSNEVLLSRGSTACCLGDGTCAVLIPALCEEAGGTASLAGNTPCSAMACSQTCSADVDGDGEVGILDFLDVLRAWGACP